MTGGSSVPADVREAWTRAGARLGRFRSGLTYRDEVTSTNDVALALMTAGAPEGTVCLADAQTAGRGRRGHAWRSPPGAGIYVSVLLRPAQAASADVDSEWVIPRVTLMAGVAVAHGIRAGSGLDVGLKWPNDVVVQGRKVAGVLAEVATAAAESGVVLGIGLNVGTAVYPRGLANRATSLEVELGRPVDRALVLVETLAALDGWYETLLAGRFDAILAEWRRLAPALLGSAIEWDGPDGVTRGRAVDVDQSGALVAQAGSRRVRLVAGDVRWTG